MIVGFNHNITYRGSGFHVQTEDSGIKKPQLITLLYSGGIIISSQKTTYADILKVDDLDKVVEELAKEQHKGMLRRLTKGEFDERIVALGISLAAPAIQSAAQTPPLQPEAKSVPESASKLVAEPEPVVEPAEVKSPVEAAIQVEPTIIVEEPIIDKFKSHKISNEPSLDELIYAYLTAGQG